MTAQSPQRFHSRVDAWYVGIVALTLGCMLFTLVHVVRDGKWAAAVLLLVIGAPSLALPLWLWRATWYEFAGTDLRVRSGPFQWRVPLAQIRRVTPTRSLLSAPALSLRRLRIDYGRAGTVVISPRDRAGFAQALRRHCPQAELVGF